MDRYLKFRLDNGTGLGNRRMTLDIGVGLAWLMDRRLILTDVAPLWAGSNPILGKSEPTLLDLFDVPLRIEAEDALEGEDVCDLGWPDLMECAFPTEDQIAAPEVEAFLQGRTLLRVDVRAAAAKVVEVRTRTLAQYSTFFLLEPRVRTRFLALMAGIRAKRAYLKFADAVAGQLGPFDAVHIRRGDAVRTGVLQDVQGADRDLLRTLEETVSGERQLVILTDEPQHSLVGQIREAYPCSLLLDEWLTSEPAIRERFLELPHASDSVLALCDILIAALAEVFVGTLGSTFTGMIHRERALHHGDARFLYVANPFPEIAGRFRRGHFVDDNEGRFSWNRAALPIPPGGLSWFREWPECAG